MPVFNGSTGSWRNWNKKCKGSENHSFLWNSSSLLCPSATSWGFSSNSCGLDRNLATIGQTLLPLEEQLLDNSTKTTKQQFGCIASVDTGYKGDLIVKVFSIGCSRMIARPLIVIVCCLWHQLACDEIFDKLKQACRIEDVGKRCRSRLDWSVY